MSAHPDICLIFVRIILTVCWRKHQIIKPSLLPLKDGFHALRVPREAVCRFNDLLFVVSGGGR